MFLLYDTTCKGKSRSPSVENVTDSIKSLLDKGVKEVVLTGVNIGDFGIFDPKKPRQNNFLDLLNQINKIKDLKRLRISSIEPNLLNNDIIDIVSESEKYFLIFTFLQKVARTKY